MPRSIHTLDVVDGEGRGLSVAVLDHIGDVFERVSALRLTTDLSRIVDARRLVRASAVDRIVYAAHSALDWDLIAALSRHAPVLVISTTYERSEAAEALRWGLLGYLDVGLPGPALARAVRGAVLSGEPGFARDVIGVWLRELRASAGAAASVTGLTLRQSEILGLIAQGATDKEIAARLGIATATTQKHVANILRRLGVPNRAAAVAARTPLSAVKLKAIPSVADRERDAMKSAS